MVYHQESMIFAELPVELPADVVINDGGKNNVWTYTKWIPHSLERKFFQISQIQLHRQMFWFCKNQISFFELVLLTCFS